MHGQLVDHIIGEIIIPKSPQIIESKLKIISLSAKSQMDSSEEWFIGGIRN